MDPLALDIGFIIGAGPNEESGGFYFQVGGEPMVLCEVGRQVGRINSLDVLEGAVRVGPIFGPIKEGVEKETQVKCW